MAVFEQKEIGEGEKNTEEEIYNKLKKIKVSSSLVFNTKVIDCVFKDNNGIKRRDLSFGKNNIKIAIFFIDGMVNTELLESNIIKPLLEAKADSESNITLSFLRHNVIASSKVEGCGSFDTLIYKLLSGDTLLFAEGCTEALIISISDIKQRSVDTPDSEQTVRGPKEAFVENLNINLVLIRKIIKTPELQIDMFEIGKRTRDPLALVYFKGVINPRIPKEIGEELDKINIDGALGSGQIEHLIQKGKWSFFPQMIATERVDRAIGAVLEGRAVILFHGTPFCLIIPSTMAMFLNTADDYQERPFITSLFRIIRYLGFFLATSASALYLAVTAYQPGLIPTALLLSITGSRSGLPFPIVIEILIMEMSLYLIQEASVRLPKMIGQTVSIVGGLVIGQAVVQAGIISPVVVIVVAISAISSYTLPIYSFSVATIIIRILLIFSSAILGLYGYIITAIAILIHAASIENYGVKYLADYSPYNKENIKDTFIIAAQHTVKKRPTYLNTINVIRQRFKLRKDNNE